MFTFGGHTFTGENIVHVESIPAKTFFGRRLFCSHNKLAITLSTGKRVTVIVDKMMLKVHNGIFDFSCESVMKRFHHSVEHDRLQFKRMSVGRPVHPGDSSN